jgi:hypothetical protein
MYNMRKAVDAGLRQQDHLDPNWFNKIYRTKLHMGSCKDCMLGQQYGDFEEGVKALGLDDESAVNLGYSIPRFMIYDGCDLVDRFWKALNRMWKEAIMDRECWTS